MIPRLLVVFTRQLKILVIALNELGASASNLSAFVFVFVVAIIIVVVELLYISIAIVPKPLISKLHLFTKRGQKSEKSKENGRCPNRS